MDTDMISCESPTVKKVVGSDENGDSGSSSGSSTVTSVSTDSCPSPPKKRLHIDFTLPENREVAALNEDSDSDSEDLFAGEYDKEAARLGCKWHPPEVFKPPVEKYAKEALLFLKDNKGEDYEFLKIKSTFPAYSQMATHMNFYARLKGSGAFHLLFAEVDHDNGSNKVVACSVVRYSEFSSPKIVIHPTGVSCWDCEEYDKDKGYWDCCGVCDDSDDE